MENYIIINGKKSKLTEEQLKALGIEVEKKRNNPFDRNEKYCTILEGGAVAFNITDDHSYYEDNLYKNINYFNDVNFAQQLAWHELLNRKLLKYAWDNEAEDYKWDEDGANSHYSIYFDSAKGCFVVADNHYCHGQNIYFSKQEIAKQAIEDIIKPFVEKHPNFKW